MAATAPTTEPRTLRASHRRVLQLFVRFGDMSDSEAYEAARADGWQISPSGLRSRRAELCPPRGAGIRDTGRRRKSPLGTSTSAVWGIDPNVTEPYAGRAN